MRSALLIMTAAFWLFQLSSAMPPKSNRGNRKVRWNDSPQPDDQNFPYTDPGSGSSNSGSGSERVIAVPKTNPRQAQANSRNGQPPQQRNQLRRPDGPLPLNNPALLSHKAPEFRPTSSGSTTASIQQQPFASVDNLPPIIRVVSIGENYFFTSTLDVFGPDGSTYFYCDPRFSGISFDPSIPPHLRAFVSKTFFAGLDYGMAMLGQYQYDYRVTMQWVAASNETDNKHAVRLKFVEKANWKKSKKYLCMMAANAEFSCYRCGERNDEFLVSQLTAIADYPDVFIYQRKTSDGRYGPRQKVIYHMTMTAFAYWNMMIA